MAECLLVMRPLDENFVVFCFDVDLHADFSFFKSVIEKEYILLNIVVDYDVNRSMLIERVMLIGVRLVKKIYVKIQYAFSRFSGLEPCNPRNNRVT